CKDEKNQSKQSNYRRHLGVRIEKIGDNYTAVAVNYIKAAAILVTAFAAQQIDWLKQLCKQ
ncbi:hypothetical protein TYRP_000427, partial [Tyrophagus putrescentiae]